jgi:hypothetical protein
VKIKYVDQKFTSQSLVLIELCNAVIADYQRQGFVLTLRQLYYQCVARNIIENTKRSYKRLGDLISNGRLAGLIDWSAIEDRGRNLVRHSHWENPSGVIASARRAYGIDMWEGQEVRVEVAVEKDSLVSIMAAACDPLDVSYIALRGYCSQSEMWAMAMRLREYKRMGHTPILLHLGDHDPSGLDMTRDNNDRLAMFMGGVEVRRLALNWDQIERYGPPPNPAKVSDSRFAAYEAEFGDESWELDSMQPQVLVDLIRDAILSVRDDEAWDERVALLEEGKILLEETERRWGEIVEFLEG